MHPPHLRSPPLHYSTCSRKTKKRRIQLLSFRHFIRPSRYPQARCVCYTSRYHSRSSLHPPNTDASSARASSPCSPYIPAAPSCPNSGLHFGSLYIWSTASSERLDDPYRNRKTKTDAKRLHAG